MASSTTGGDENDYKQEIRLVHSGDLWVATDVETGVASQGETRAVALANLDEAIALHRGEIGRPPSDEELRELGIDPDDNVTGEEEPPEVLDSS